MPYPLPFLVAVVALSVAVASLVYGSAFVPARAGTQGSAAADGRPGWYVAVDGRADHDGSAEHPLDLATALSERSPATPGHTIWLRGGTYRGAFTSVLTGTADAPIVVRAWPGERVTIDGRDAPANTLTINGAHTWFWGFEVTNTDPVRLYDRAVDLEPDAPDRVRGVAVNVFGPGTRCINLVVHDALGGFGLWEPAVDAEVHGALVYHNGVIDTVRGHGHGLYIQNRAGTKRIEDVIAFGNYATGMKAYGEAGWAQGVHFEGVVSFDNGIASRSSSPLEKMENLLVGTTDNPADRIAILSSAFYHRPRVLASNLSLGYQNLENGTVVVENTVVAGGSVALSVKGWRESTVTNNVFYATTSENANSDQSLAQLRQGSDAVARWSGNQYLDGTDRKHGFVFNGLAGRSGAGNLGFDDWQALSGTDADSTYAVGAPTENLVIVRPNRYEPGRAHIVVYNWTAAASTHVDLSRAGLRAGDRYEIRDAQNYFGVPVGVGTYDGSAIELPLEDLRAAGQIGEALFERAHTAPAFAVFIVSSPSRSSEQQ